MTREYEKELFENLYREHIHRPGSEELLSWLNQTDFFTAPASTKYDMAVPHGLVNHSIGMYQRLTALVKMENLKANDESVAIVGLLHDVGKANYFAEEEKNVKNAQGQWVKQKYYTIKDALPLGEAKSLFLISSVMHLTPEEAMAIRWVKGGFDTAAKNNSPVVSNAFRDCPLAVLASIADTMAIYLDLPF